MIFGSNDLTALTLGIDRSDPGLQYLFNEEQPSVLSFMIKTVEECKKRNVLTAIGGEAASKQSLMKKLYQAGINAFSVSPNIETISNSKKFIRDLEEN